jgi:hypothetical protein
VHRTPRAAILSAVAIATALGLCACGDDTPSGSPPSAATLASTPPPITAPPTLPPSETAAPVAPLPPPEALTDVLARLADADVPGAEKLDIIEDSTPSDAASMDKFVTALRDGHYAPLTFEARDLTWVDGRQDAVLAMVTIKTSNPQAGDFTFPMEFRLDDGRWQLSRRTSDSLLQIGETPTPTP